MRIKYLLRSCTALLLSTFLQTQLSYAQSYPSKPISIIVPVPPGGVADMVARVFAAKAGEHATIVVENKTGGAGIPGTLAVSKAPADGYTLLTGLPWAVVNSTASSEAAV